MIYGNVKRTISAQVIRNLRNDAGISQVKAAEIFGVSLGQFDNWENCRHTMSAETFLMICMHFSVDINQEIRRAQNDIKRHGVRKAG